MNNTVLSITTNKIGEIAPNKPETKKEKELNTLYYELESLHQHELFDKYRQKLTKYQEKELDDFCYAVENYDDDYHEDVVKYANEVIFTTKTDYEDIQKKLDEEVFEEHKEFANEVRLEAVESVADIEDGVLEKLEEDAGENFTKKEYLNETRLVILGFWEGVQELATNKIKEKQYPIHRDFS